MKSGRFKDKVKMFFKKFGLLLDETLFPPISVVYFVTMIFQIMKTNLFVRVVRKRLSLTTGTNV